MVIILFAVAGTTVLKEKPTTKEIQRELFKMYTAYRNHSDEKAITNN